jgi:hypothetical protein
MLSLPGEHSAYIHFIMCLFLFFIFFGVGTPALPSERAGNDPGYNVSLNIKKEMTNDEDICFYVLKKKKMSCAKKYKSKSDDQNYSLTS